MLILETGLQERAARMSPGYSQSLTQTRSPESLTYVDEIPVIKSFPEQGHASSHTLSWHRRATITFGCQC